jgi:hypothetical protein
MPNNSWIKTSGVPNTQLLDNSTTQKTILVKTGNANTKPSVTATKTVNGAIFDQISNIRCNEVTGTYKGTLDDVLTKCSNDKNLGGLGSCIGVEQNRNGTYSGCLNTYTINNSMPNTAPNTTWIKR